MRRTKIVLLRYALVSQDWAEHIFSRVAASTTWRDLCTELGNALQLRIERESSSVSNETTLREKGSNLPFTLPLLDTLTGYQKKLVPGAEINKSC